MRCWSGNAYFRFYKNLKKKTTKIFKKTPFYGAGQEIRTCILSKNANFARFPLASQEIRILGKFDPYFFQEIRTFKVGGKDVTVKKGVKKK